MFRIKNEIVEARINRWGHDFLRSFFGYSPSDREEIRLTNQLVPLPKVGSVETSRSKSTLVNRGPFESTLCGEQIILNV
jgi:hypothetical protein